MGEAATTAPKFAEMTLLSEVTVMLLCPAIAMALQKEHNQNNIYRTYFAVNVQSKVSWRDGSRDVKLSTRKSVAGDATTIGPIGSAVVTSPNHLTGSNSNLDH